MWTLGLRRAEATQEVAVSSFVSALGVGDGGGLVFKMLTAFVGADDVDGFIGEGVDLHLVDINPFTAPKLSYLPRCTGI